MAFVMCNLDSMARLLVRLTSRGVVYVAYVLFNSPVALGSYALRLLHTFNLSVSPANISVSAVLHTALKVVNNKSNSPWLSSDAYMRTSVVQKHGLTEVTLLHTDHASDQSFIVCSTGIRYIRVVNAAVIARSLSKRNKDRQKGVDDVDPYKIDDVSKVAYLYCRRKHVQGDPIVFWLKLLQNRQRFPLGDVEDWKVRQRLCSYVSDSHSG